MSLNLDTLTLEGFKAAPREALPELAADVRRFLIESISKTGGHIGANLGVVELSIAMHRVFSSPDDAFVFDTGHTGYTHKLLTGRLGLFPTLNTYGGMNRFVARSESEHDFIEASHAGTAISVALGRAIALRNQGLPHFSVAFTGDGALCEGLALEALNHASVEPGIKMLIVLNDNGYAISPGFGAIHQHLQKRTVGAKEADALFSSLGYTVIGPVDGHDIGALLDAFETAKATPGVCIVHAKTEKGRGLPPAANHPFKLHFSFAFDPETGAAKDSTVLRNHQDVAALAVADCMEENPAVMAITPSTLYATGLAGVFKRFPERCFDPGMEEQHAVSMAVGMALSGARPVLFYQSTFLQRAFDQLIHDVCFANQDMLILTVRSGFAGYDNPTHHGIYDFSYLRCLPNVQEFYPRDSQELYGMVKAGLTTLKGPVLIHMPYGPDDQRPVDQSAPLPEMHAPELLRQGKDGIILAVGNKADACVKAAEIMEASGKSFGVASLRKLKPLAEKALLELVAGAPRVVTVEEGILEGGVGSAVSALLHQADSPASFLRVGLPCIFVEPGSNDELCAKYGLDAQGIARQILERWS